MRRDPTPAERRLWYRLRDRRLGSLKFRRQAPLGPFILDVFCPERRLAVEVDGGHHFDPRGEAADAERESWLRAQGIRVLRVSNREVTTNIDVVCETILAAANDGGRP